MNCQQSVRVHIRWMIRRDMPEVLAIEHAAYESPWQEEEFLRLLRQRNCIGHVAEVGEAVVGFMVYELNKGHIRLQNLAVAPAWRYRGVGSQMVAKLVGKLSDDRRTRLLIDVRETNLGAQLFLRSAGFAATGVLPAHYPDTGEDGYAMAYELEA